MGSLLTPSLRRPFKPAIFFRPPIGQRVNTHSVFWEFCRKPCQHATRGCDKRWMTCIHAGVSRSPREHASVPRTKGTAVSEWVHSFVDFCLIPLSTTCSVEVPGTNLYRWIYNPLSLMPLRNSVCSTGCGPIIDRCFGACNGTSCAEDDHNKKARDLILKMSMNEAFIWLSGHRIIDREIFNG